MQKLSEMDISHIDTIIQDDSISGSLEKTKEYAAILDDYVGQYSFEGLQELYLKVLCLLGGFHAQSGNLHRATELFDELLLKAKKEKIGRLVNCALTNIATLKARNGLFCEAIEAWSNLLRRKIGEDSKKSVYNNLMIGYSMVGQTSRALKIGYQLIEKLENEAHELDLISVLMNQGTAYHYISNTEKAFGFWFRALELAEKYDQSRYISMACNNISTGYSSMQDYEKALMFAGRNLDIMLRDGNSYNLSIAYNNIGSIYENLQDYDKALANYQKALDLIAEFEDEDDLGQHANCLLNLASILYQQGSYPQALDYINQADKLREMSNTSLIQKRVYEHFAKNYKAMGDYANALKYTELLGEEFNKQIDDMLESMISKPEADYYRRKIELHAIRYQEKNQELRKLNKRIRNKSLQLASTNSSLQQNIMVLSRLISILSHDVRSPIANVVQTLNLINDRHMDLEESRDILVELEINGKRVLGFINELLSWISEEKNSRIEHLELKVFNLIPVLSSVVDLYDSIAQYKEITVVTDFPESVVEALTEPNALKIVLRNLLGNVVKFTPHKGRIVVKAYQEGEMAVIKVIDSGAGLDVETLNKLKTGKALSPHANGDADSYGLGLRLCFHYVEKLKGTLEIESEPKNGTSIKITLPTR